MGSAAELPVPRPERPPPTGFHGPRVVLADEPTGSLDAESSAKVVDLLLRLQKQEGTTLVIVTHDPAVAALMDATVQMRDGRLAGAQGPRACT